MENQLETIKTNLPYGYEKQDCEGGRMLTGYSAQYPQQQTCFRSFNLQS